MCSILNDKRCCYEEQEEEIEATVRNSVVDWQALQSPNWQRRREAVSRLGLCGIEADGGSSVEVLVALRKAFKDEHWQVRRQGVYALRELGETAVHEAAPELWRASADQDACVRSAALFVLQIHGVEQIREKSKDQEELAYYFRSIFDSTEDDAVTSRATISEAPTFTRAFWKRYPEDDMNNAVIVQRSAGDENDPIAEPDFDYIECIGESCEDTPAEVSLMKQPSTSMGVKRELLSQVKPLASKVCPRD